MSIDDEVLALRTSAGWSRADHVALVQVDGPSAFDLQSAASHNLYLREGRVRQTLFLRDDAGVFADVFIGLADDGFYVLGEGPSEAALVAWLEGVRDRNPTFARVVVRGLSAERTILGVDGPYAWEVLAGVFGRAVLGMPYLTLMRRGDVVCVRAGKTGAVAIGFCGDGATSQGDFHSAMNFAGVWRAPCVLVCQNNHWSISVPTSKQTASRTLAVKARAYGIPGLRVDGNDLLAMHRAMTGAIDRARNGGGPTFIEAVTYRMGAHSTSDDPTRYRAQAEVDAWAKKDPLDRLRRHLVQRGLVTGASDEALDAELTAEIAAAIDAVESLPPPPRESLLQDVFAEPTWNLREQMAELSRTRPAPTH